MFKIRRKTVFVASPTFRNRLGSPPPKFSVGRAIANALTIVAAIAGGLIGIVFFSAFFAVLLIPLAIWGARSWWRFRQMTGSRTGQILDAEYTVVDDGSSDSGKTEND